MVDPGRITPTTIGQLCAGKVLNSPPPPSVQQRETKQSQCSVILLLGTKNCQQSTRAGFCYSQRSVSSARDLVAVHVIGVTVCSGSSPNGHSRKQTALLTAAFTKHHFSQPPYKLYDIVSYYIPGKRPAPVTRTFATSRGFPLTRASTVLKFSSPYNKYFAAQACLVKMVSYWPSSYFLFSQTSCSVNNA